MSTLNQLQKQMLNILLDRYERSRMFLGINRNMRLPQFEMAKIYPVYTDDSEYSAFCECNEAVAGLEKAGLVIAEYGRGDVIERVLLCVDELEAAYRAVSHIPRAGIQAELKSLIENELISPLMSEEYMASLSDYLREQLQRIEENKDVEFREVDL